VSLKGFFLIALCVIILTSVPDGHISALVVEDDPDLATLLAGELAAEAAFNPIEVVGDGAQAMALLASGFVPGLVLLDLELPKVHGREVLSRLRADPIFSRTAVVVTGSEGAREPGEPSLPGEVFFPKPFKLDELREVIRAAVEGKGEGAPLAEALLLESEGPRERPRALRARSSAAG